MIAAALLLLATAPVPLRPDAPALTPEQAKAMTPAALGDALLASGHPVVVETAIGSDVIFGPPPPPGQAVATPIRLFLPAVRDAHRGFCIKQVLTVTLAPVVPEGPRRLPPARPATLASGTLYRWAESGRCEAPRRQFFPVAGKDGFEAIRLLARAQLLARKGRLRSPISFIDREQEFGAAPLRDARTALLAFPIGAISDVGSRFDPALHAVDLRAGAAARSGVELFAGGEWHAGLVIEAGRLSLIRLVRALPPPF